VIHLVGFLLVYHAIKNLRFISKDILTHIYKIRKPLDFTTHPGMTMLKMGGIPDVSQLNLSDPITNFSRSKI